jgi:diguanylate cyclase (GGDEF)-like protein
MTVRRAQLWHVLSLRPAGISLRTSCSALAAMLAVVGTLLVVSGLLEPSMSPATRPVYLVSGGAGLALAVVTALAWRRLPLGAFFAFHACASMLLGHAVRRADTGTAALTVGMLFMLLLVESFFVLSWLEAGSEFLFGIVSLTWGLSAHPTVTAMDIGVLIAVLTATCWVAGWLVRVTEKADIDHLTGVANRRGVQRRSESLLLRAERQSLSVGFALIDLDHFKSVNDSLGHAAGDELLCAVVAAAQRVLPGNAVFGRWGGDEFALVVPATTPDVVVELVERIRAGLPAGRTMSVGVEMCQGQPLSEVVQRADQALYEVKRSRRGATRVFAADVPPSTPPPAPRAAPAGDVRHVLA